MIPLLFFWEIWRAIKILRQLMEFVYVLSCLGMLIKPNLVKGLEQDENEDKEDT